MRGLFTNVNTYREEKTKEYDFREMAKVPEAMRGKMKHLQAGPRYRKQKEKFKKKTGIVLTKLVLRIQEMLPEIQWRKQAEDSPNIPSGWKVTRPLPPAKWKNARR